MLVSTYGYTYVSKIGIDERTDMSFSVDSFKVSKDNKIGGSFDRILLRVEYRTALGSSYRDDYGIKLGIDKVTDLGSSVGSYKEYKYVNLDNGVSGRAGFWLWQIYVAWGQW